MRKAICSSQLLNFHNYLSTNTPRIMADHVSGPPCDPIRYPRHPKNKGSKDGLQVQRESGQWSVFQYGDQVGLSLALRPLETRPCFLCPSPLLTSVSKLSYLMLSLEPDQSIIREEEGMRIQRTSPHPVLDNATHILSHLMEVAGPAYHWSQLFIIGTTVSVTVPVPCDFNQLN